MDFGNYTKIFMMKNKNNIIKYNLARNTTILQKLPQLHFN